MRRRCRRRLVLPPLLALFAASGGGCSAGSDDVPDRDELSRSEVGAEAEVAGTPGCELLTAQEIEAATGVAPARREWDETVVRGCSWYQESGKPLLGLTIGAAPRTYEAYLNNLREMGAEGGTVLEGMDTSFVAGIGDYAIWHEADGSDFLNAASDGELFVLMIFDDPVNGRTARDAVLELARLGVPRL